MAEEKKAAAKTEAKEKKGAVKDSRAELKTSKPRWTLARARRRARRFATEDQWRAGHPSSYKSAAHHGWIAECVAAMGKPVEQMRKKAA